MDKVWYIDIEGKKEGPYSFIELKKDPRLTPDTLIWREGFSKWVPIRLVSELKDLFKDEEQSAGSKEDEGAPENGKLGDVNSSEDMTLTIREDPFNFLFWVLIAIVVVSFALYQFYMTHK